MNCFVSIFRDSSGSIYTPTAPDSKYEPGSYLVLQDRTYGKRDHTPGHNNFRGAHSETSFAYAATLPIRRFSTPSALVIGMFQYSQPLTSY